eukprot:ctg_714.g298
MNHTASRGQALAPRATQRSGHKASSRRRRRAAVARRHRVEKCSEARQQARARGHKEMGVSRQLLFSERAIIHRLCSAAGRPWQQRRWRGADANVPPTGAQAAAATAMASNGGSGAAASLANSAAASTTPGGGGYATYPLERAVDAVAERTQFGAEALSLVGGNVGEERRLREQTRLAEDVRRMVREGLPRHCRLDVRDIAWVSPDLCFVGVGIETNFAGFRYAMSRNLFQARRVAAVRDIFDRSAERRATLDRVFKVVSDDVTAMLAEVQEPPRARLVNEYVAPFTFVHSTRSNQHREAPMSEGQEGAADHLTANDPTGPAARTALPQLARHGGAAHGRIHPQPARCGFRGVSARHWVAHCADQHRTGDARPDRGDHPRAAIHEPSAHGGADRFRAQPLRCPGQCVYAATGAGARRYGRRHHRRRRRLAAHHRDDPTARAGRIRPAVPADDPTCGGARPPLHPRQVPRRARFGLSQQLVQHAHRPGGGRVHAGAVPDEVAEPTQGAPAGVYLPAALVPAVHARVRHDPRGEQQDAAIPGGHRLRSESGAHLGARGRLRPDHLSGDRCAQPAHLPHQRDDVHRHASGYRVRGVDRGCARARPRPGPLAQHRPRGGEHQPRADVPILRQRAGSGVAVRSSSHGHEHWRIPRFHARAAQRAIGAFG